MILAKCHKMFSSRRLTGIIAAALSYGMTIRCGRHRILIPAILAAARAPAYAAKIMENLAAAMTTREAILLLGPTGSGKTPLGQVLEERGLWGHACLHFDFGANLREIVARNKPDESIGAEDITLLRRMVQGGLLLEDEHFPLAAQILRRFMVRRSPTPTTWIVLNGLPRHQGQATALEGIVDVRMVVYLECSAPVVAERILCNVGGDQEQRDDDDAETIRRKLAIFTERTAPLLHYYRSREVRIETVEVGPDTTAEEMWRMIESSGPRE
jgi:adenylate kinase